MSTTPAQSVPPTTERVIDLTGETEEPDSVYPMVSELLAELDESMPALGLARYEEQLLAVGFTYVHQLVDSPAVRTTLLNLEFPIAIVEEIIERAQRMTRRAAKLKSVIKDEENANHER